MEKVVLEFLRTLRLYAIRSGLLFLKDEVDECLKKTAEVAEQSTSQDSDL